MTWDKLHDHISKVHKAVQVVAQDYASLLQCPDIFRYRKTLDGRIFAIPLRVVQMRTGVQELIVNMEICQMQNLQPGEWVIKKEDVAVPKAAAPGSAGSTTYSMPYQGGYNGLGSYGLSSASGNTMGSTTEWQVHATIPDASVSMPFQGPIPHVTQEQAALMPAVNFSPAPNNNLLSYSPIPPHAGMAVYPGMPSHGIVSAPEGVPVTGNIIANEPIPSPHGLPAQQEFSINGNIAIPYAQSLNSQFGAPLMPQDDNGTEFSEQRRVSNSTESASYSDRIDYSNGEMQDLTERQAYGAQYQAYVNNVQPYREGYGSLGDASRPSGDGSQSPLPDLTCSEAQSPAEIEDNLPIHLDDFGIKEDDANGFPMPNQYYSNM